MAVAIDRLMSYQKAAKNEFSDLDSSWYTEALLKANAAGIILGSDGKIRPNDHMSRQEAAVIFARVFGLNIQGAPNLTFADSAEVAPWAAKAVGAMAARGYMAGVGGNRFAPNADISRASVAKLLGNAVHGFYAAGGTHSEAVTGLAVITKPDTILKDMTISGDLIIAEGVGEGKVTLDHVTVTGTTTVRGGGQSLALLGGTTLGKLTLAKAQGEKLVVAADKDVKITDMVLQSGDLLLKGSFNTLTVSGKAGVEIDKDASLATAVLSAPGVALTVNGSAPMIIAEAAATGATIDGSGKAAAVLSSAGDVKVTTPGTKVSVAAGVTGVTLNGTAVKPEPATASPVASLSVSPNHDKIVADLTRMPTMKDIPYDPAVTYHSAAAETKSHPFSSMYCSVGAVNLQEYGYAEKEYFMSGTANVYGISPWSKQGTNVPVVTLPDESYTTRVLLRYPTDPAKFTGKVYIDILNASSGVDLEDVWRRSYDHIMKEGHAYIGITSKSLTATALQKFDPKRYADLDWGTSAYADENGLVWDMLGQLGTWANGKDAAALFGKPVTNVYLSGQSQSGFYMNTFLNVFYPYLNNALGGKDVFSGYMNLVGSGNTNLSGGNAADAKRDVPVTGSWAKTEEPYIVMMSGMEATFQSDPGFGYQRVADQNSATHKFRLYEVAGAPHSDPTVGIIPNDAEIARAKANGEGRGNKVYDAAHYETDLNLDPFVDAMLDNIDAWAAKGTPAPNADQHWVKTGKDADGNQLGGIRSPLIEAPIATYYPARNNSFFQTDGSMVYFTRGRAVELYGNKETYVAKVKAQADKLLADKYITASGKTWFYDYADSALLFGGPDNAAISASVAKVPTVVEKPYGAAVTAHTKSLATQDPKTGIYTTEAKFSHPYASMLCSNGGVDVADYGYTEKEFFLSGTANVYGLGEYGNDVPTVKTADQPYTNRVLVRMPKDMSKFSGRVYIDIANASNKSDMEDTWRRSWKFFMENNHGYILVTSKDVNVQALKNFDKDRYADINWMVDGKYENGLFWDMLSQLGTALKTPATKAQLLGCAKDKSIHTYLGGQSQSGFYINTYVSVFQQYLAQANSGKPLFDGYYNLVGQMATSISG
ncbi:MAG: alpha/beta hydrolase domain-containing protein, partial [Pseudoflavonifractor sp.]